jgi:Protein of unknown function (DUF3551)
VPCAVQLPDRVGGSRETSMRLSMLLLIAAAVLGEIQSTSAQSPTSYPWCSKGTRGGGLSCRYASYDQCRTTQSGIGGTCMRSPYYRGGPPNAPVLSRRRRPA